jgi:hypothetical protein
MIRHVTISSVKDMEGLVAAINKSLRTLVDQINIDKPSTPVTMNGQRISDVGYPVAQNDVVTLSYLTREFKRQHPRISTKPSTFAVVQIKVGTHSERLAFDINELTIGDVWFESDRTSFYQVREDTGDTVKWVFMSGRFVGDFADKPGDLATDDEGFEFAADDVDHNWRWTGSAWEWAPQERLPGELAAFSVSPGAGWAICTGGSATAYTAVATSTTVTVPDMRDFFVVGASSYTGVGVAETVGTFTATSSADGEHDHTGTVTINANSSAVTFATGTNALATAAALSHSHTGSVALSTATGHQHVVSGTSTGASPAKFAVMWHMRL